MGHNNNNMGATWAQYNNKGDTLVLKGLNMPLFFKKVLSSKLE